MCQSVTPHFCSCQQAVTQAVGGMLAAASTRWYLPGQFCWLWVVRRRSSYKKTDPSWPHHVPIWTPGTGRISEVKWELFFSCLLCLKAFFKPGTQHGSSREGHRNTYTTLWELCFLLPKANHPETESLWFDTGWISGTINEGLWAVCVLVLVVRVGNWTVDKTENRGLQTHQWHERGDNEMFFPQLISMTMSISIWWFYPQSKLK